MIAGIIGPGVVGSTVAIKLSQQGYDIRMIAGRTTEKAQKLAERIGATACSVQELLQNCDLVFIATPDRVIEPLVKEMKEYFHPGQVLVHFSGSLNSRIMAAADLKGAQLLSLHPLQTFASTEVALSSLAGAHFAIEGDNPELGCRLVKDLGGIPHLIDPNRKTLYHAAACFASNYLVVLAAIAVDLFKCSGFSEEEALPALLPLMRGVLNSLEAAGLPQALTGPIARGDDNVVAAHLQEMPKPFEQIYKQLGSLALDIALDKKTIGSREKNRLQRLLKDDV